ncbi:MAG: hypothetical protein GY841_21760 [FCB group bacterium]|nr:hypothetical protein [FCB group bacterium]
MRKVFLTIIAIILFGSAFIGCGDDDKGTGSVTPSGIYAEMYIQRMVNTSGWGPIEQDVLLVYLDSAYSTDGNRNPIDSAGISCGDYGLSWSDRNQFFFGPSRCVDCSFIEPGGTYTYSIGENQYVPALTQSITFPAELAYLYYPRWNDTIQINDGIEVIWHDSGTGTVEISLWHDGVEVYQSEVPNDGQQRIPRSVLQTLPTGDYYLSLIQYRRQSIHAIGYDPRSFIEANVTTTNRILLQP